MAVPFAKMHAAVTAERRDRETRDALSKLAKALVGKYAYKAMRDYDQRMCDLTIKDAGDAFMSCVPDNPLHAELHIDINKPVSIITILRGDFSKGELNSILLKLAKSYSRKCEALVLFKVKHLGIWVAYNTADPFPLSIPRLVVPSTCRGQNAITIMPLSTYIKMWNAKRGDND